MTKLALIEVDKTIANISEREQRAKVHAEARVRELGARSGNERWHSEYMNILYSQEGIYNPDLVLLDTPIQGAAETLAQLHQAGYRIEIHTCRAHWMASATEIWLKRHAISHDLLKCKNLTDRTERFTKHVTWKAKAVDLAAPEHDLVLYVDAEKRNVEAVERVGHANVFTATSLVSLQLPTAVAPSTTFYWRKASSDYELIDSRSRRVRLRLSDEERAQHFTDLWNRVVGPPPHCGSCGREIAEDEHTFGHSHYLALCFSCSCANEGD
jgi:hypothetical protein